MFWDKVRDGFHIMGHSLKFGLRHPWMLVPFFLAWFLYGVAIFYAQDLIDFEALSTVELLLVAYVVYVIFTTLVSIASLILLELLEQNEDTGKMNILKAFKDAFVYDLYKTIPIILGWSVVKVGVLLIRIVAGTTKGKKNRSTYLSRSINRWADRIDKGARLLIFLILPGIALDDRSTRDAYDTGRYLFKNQFATVLSGYGLTSALNLVLFLPVLLYFVIIYFSVTIPVWSIYVLIAYLGITWSFGMLVEQLFCGELYIWYSRVTKGVHKAKAENRPLAGISTNNKPEYLNGLTVEDPFAQYDSYDYDNA